MRNMRYVLTLMLAVLALVAAWYFLLGRTPPSSPPAVQVPAIDPTGAPTPPSPPLDPLVESPTAAARVEAPEVVAETEPAPTASSAWPRAHVFGRLVDDRHAPASDVELVLSSVGKTWAPDQTVPVIERRGWKIPGFSTRSDADGKFELDVPVPTSEWISLSTHAPDYLGIVGKEFGPAGGRKQPRIVAGDNDVGELVLAITGAASGEVRAVDGSAIANAEVRLEGHFPGGYGISTQCDRTGRFVLGHVPEGSWPILAKAEGYLSATIQSVEVKRRATTPGLAFRLERAPTISGRVVDEDGRPLEKMWIWGWPIGSGQGAGATSKADGTFVIYLPQNEPYRLELEERSNKGRFEPWGGHGSDKLFDPGTDDVLVQLKRAVRTTFVVVDDESGAPVEQYAIELVVRPDESGNTFGRSSRQARVDSHANGECTLAADPGRHRVQVIAPGFEDVEVDVAHDDPAETRQTLRMKPGAALVGRVRHGDDPVPGAKLVLARDHIKVDASLPDAQDPWFDDNYTTDMSEFLGRQRTIEGAQDGSFRIGDLAAGTYSLTVNGGNGAPVTLHGLRVESGATRDVGEIVLGDSGTLHVRLVTGPGQEALDISLGIDDDWSGLHERSGAQREFTFKNLVPGSHKLIVRMHGAGVQDRQEAPFSITANATTELSVDLAAKAPCKTRIRVLSLGKPAAGLEVAWQSLVDGRMHGGGTIGTTNDEGVATGSLPGGVEARFVVKSDGGLVVGRSAASIRMPAASLYEGEIEVRSGTLVLEFPASMEIPDDGSFHLMLTGADQDRQMTSWSTPHSRFSMNKHRWTERRCSIGAIAPGTYELSLGAQMRGDGNVYVPLLERFERTITIRDGETTVVQIEEQSHTDR